MLERELTCVCWGEAAGREKFMLAKTAGSGGGIPAKTAGSRAGAPPTMGVEVRLLANGAWTIWGIEAGDIISTYVAGVIMGTGAAGVITGTAAGDTIGACIADTMGAATGVTIGACIGDTRF